MTMRCVCTQIARLLPLAFVLGSTPASAQSEDQSAPGIRYLGDWIPSIGFSYGFLVDQAKGDVSSGGLRMSVDGPSDLLDQMIGGSLELASPQLPIPGKPRIFVRGSALGLFGPARILAEEGFVGQLDVPLPAPRDRVVIVIPGSVVGGQGSVVNAEIQPFAVAAGVGVSFTTKLGDRTLRIKPSFEYLREQIEVTGQVHHVLGERVVTGGAPSLDPAGDTVDDTTLFLTMLSGSEKRTFDSIGPGLQLELDIVRSGPVLMSISIEGAATRVLDDREIRFSASDPEGNTATFHFEKERWVYRAGVGIHVHFAPE